MSILRSILFANTHTKADGGKITSVRKRRKFLTRTQSKPVSFAKGAPAPSIVEVKDFLRLYVMQSTGRINNHASMESVKTNADWFYAGFTRVTGTPTDAEDRTELFWVSALLTGWDLKVMSI